MLFQLRQDQRKVFATNGRVKVHVHEVTIAHSFMTANQPDLGARLRKAKDPSHPNHRNHPKEANLTKIHPAKVPPKAEGNHRKANPTALEAGLKQGLQLSVNDSVTKR